MSGTLNQNHINGIALENPVAQFLKHKLKFGDLVDHNSFNESEYPNDNHLIVDAEVKGKALIECTNPKETTFFCDKDIGKKLDYFHRRDPKHLLIWFLVISFANFSQYIADKLKEMRIHLIELGFHAEQFSKVINRLFHSQLYQILKPHKPKPKSAQPIFIQQSLSTSVNTVNPIPNLIINNLITNNLHYNLINNNLHQHEDCNRELSIDDKEQLIMEERWLECERIRRLYGKG